MGKILLEIKNPNVIICLDAFKKLSTTKIQYATSIKCKHTSMLNTSIVVPSSVFVVKVLKEHTDVN